MSVTIFGNNEQAIELYDYQVFKDFCIELKTIDLIDNAIKSEGKEYQAIKERYQKMIKAKKHKISGEFPGEE